MPNKVHRPTTEQDTPVWTSRDSGTLVVAAVLWLPLAFLGFGSDYDTYSELDTGNRLLFGDHAYLPSRNPGYLAHEVVSAALGVAGHVPATLGTLFLALIALGSILWICQFGGVPHRHLVGIAFAVVPYVWINAAASIDYLWAIGLALAAVVVLLRQSPLSTVAAGLLFGLAIAFRLSTGLLVIGLLLFAWGLIRRATYPLSAGVLAAVTGAAFYVPSFLHVGRNLSFLQPALGPDSMWSPLMQVGRFAYKNIQLWGLPASLLLLGVLVVGVPRLLRHPPRPQRAIIYTSIGIIGSYEALFFRYPLETAYLLPAVPFLLMLVAIIVAERPALLVALGVVTAIGSLVTVQLATPDVPGMATAARFSFAIIPGPLISDTQQRIKLQGCSTWACWNDRVGVSTTTHT